MDRNFIIALIVVGSLILFKRRFPLNKVIRENKCLTFLVVYMLASTLWSNIFITSFIRWVREIAPAVIMSFIILSEKEPSEAIQSVLRRTTYILIPFSLMLIKYYPLYGVQYGRWEGNLMWIGVTMHKTSFGRLCLFAVFYLAWSLIKRWQERNTPPVKYQTAAEIFLLMMSFYLLNGPNATARSITSVISLAVGLSAFIVLFWLNKSKTYPSGGAISAIILTVLIFGTFTVFTSGEAISSYTPAMGRDTTLTGRTDIWQTYLPLAMRHPFLGHGFGGFWTAEVIELQDVTEVHNGYLEVILQFGFVGLILVALFLISSSRRAQRMLKNDFYWANLWICFLLIAVVYNITENSFGSFSLHLTAILIFLAVGFSSITENSKII